MQETIAEFTAHHNLLETRQTARLHDVDHVDGREAYVANEKANGGARTRALDRQHVEISSQPRRNSFRWPFFVASHNIQMQYNFGFTQSKQSSDVLLHHDNRI